MAANILGALRAVVLPRAAQGLVPRASTSTVRAAFRLRAKRRRSFDERDRAMAMLAPVALLTQLLAWLLIIFVAYAVMYFCLGHRSWRSATELSGSSLFTLGSVVDGRFGTSLVTYTEAAIGLLLVALFITYLPSMYGAFTRREAGVTSLVVRAGTPASALTMLLRYHRIEGRRFELVDLWSQWEVWFGDIEESHTTFPVLVFFRSPVPDRSWITAAGALLDGAAFWVACVGDHPPDPEAQLCLRAGFLSLRRIADGFKIPYDPEPAPDGPISVAREEWDAAMDELHAAGVPLVEDRDAAWLAWRGWRVNYDAVLLRLARLVEAPPAPWVSDRSPLPVDRAGKPDRRPSG